jgi:hypothetical protein
MGKKQRSVGERYRRERSGKGYVQVGVVAGVEHKNEAPKK